MPGQLSELDEWKQAAAVEAGLRREFKNRADKFEAALKEIHDYADAACEGAGEPEFSGFSWIAACSHKALNT